MLVASRLAARRGRGRVRGRHPDGLRVVPGGGPRHRRGRVRRVGQLRVGGGRAGAARRRHDGAAGAGGWRWGIGVAGVVAAVYGVVYWFARRATPRSRCGVARQRRKGALAVPTRGAVWGLVGLQVPVAGALGVVAWRIEAVGVLSPRRPGDRAGRGGGVLRLAGSAGPPGERAGAGRGASRAQLPVPRGGAPVARLRRHVRRRAGGRVAAARPSSPTRSGSRSAPPARRGARSPSPTS